MKQLFLLSSTKLAPSRPMLDMAVAGPPILVDKESGKYLGTLSTNKFDPDSTSNEYGKYGSKYSPDSINNEYGKYGSPYSPDSANNPYATNPPEIRKNRD